jgi:hypothetical protein
MALKSLSALARAIADVKKEAGDSAEYKQLLESLDGISKELGEAAPGEPERDSDDDDHSFEVAEKRHVERNAERRAAATSEAPAGGESA